MGKLALIAWQVGLQAAVGLGRENGACHAVVDVG